MVKKFEFAYLWRANCPRSHNDLPLRLHPDDAHALLVHQHAGGFEITSVALYDDLLDVSVERDVQVLPVGYGSQEGLGGAAPESVPESALGLGEAYLVRTVDVSYRVTQLLAGLQEHVRDLGVEAVVLHCQVATTSAVR